MSVNGEYHASNGEQNGASHAPDGTRTAIQPNHHNGDVPPFPPGLREAPISRMPLSGLLSQDATTQAAIIKACTTHGFFYLDLTSQAPHTNTSTLPSDAGSTLLRTSNALHALSTTAFKLPQSTKDTISFAKTGTLFGYKAAGVVAAQDPHKRRDKGEMLNVAKDDMLAFDPQSINNVAYPSPLLDAQPLFAEFSRTAHAVGMSVLDVLAAHLGIEGGELRRRHAIARRSGDHTRLTYGPARSVDATMPVSEADTPITTYAHTDFGSVTLLFNWLGGLQIESQDVDPVTGEKAWEWVRPLPGCAIINLGDAMVTFGGGRVKSGRHRVVGAPGEQAMRERYSVVYFVRPGDDVFLEDLTVGEAERERARETGEAWTAKDWIKRKAMELGNTFAGEEKPTE